MALPQSARYSLGRYSAERYSADGVIPIPPIIPPKFVFPELGRARDIEFTWIGGNRLLPRIPPVVQPPFVNRYWLAAPTALPDSHVPPSPNLVSGLVASNAVPRAPYIGNLPDNIAREDGWKAPPNVLLRGLPPTAPPPPLRPVVFSQIEVKSAVELTIAPPPNLVANIVQAAMPPGQRVLAAPPITSSDVPVTLTRNLLLVSAAVVQPPIVNALLAMPAVAIDVPIVALRNVTIRLPGAAPLRGSVFIDPLNRIAREDGWPAPPNLLTSTLGLPPAARPFAQYLYPTPKTKLEDVEGFVHSASAFLIPPIVHGVHIVNESVATSTIIDESFE